MGIYQRPLLPLEEDIQNTDDEENIAHLHIHYLSSVTKCISPEIPLRVS